MTEPINKILGSLLGLHIGDSLGATLEFGAAVPSKSHTEIIGGGPFNWEPGVPTDDTEQMIMLLNAFVDSKFDISKFATSMIEWYENGPVDIGITTTQAIHKMQHAFKYVTESGLSIDELLTKCGIDSDRSQSNGSLMRSAPMAFFATEDDHLNQTKTTHRHPTCIVADKVYRDSLIMLSNGDSPNNVLNYVVNFLHENNHTTFSSYLAKIPHMDWNDLATSGYVIHTLGAAFWGLLNTDSFESALIHIVNRGDDADTCGAVTGALCGAHYGLNNIPERWLNSIKEKEYITSKVLELIAKGNDKTHVK